MKSKRTIIIRGIPNELSVQNTQLQLKALLNHYGKILEIKLCKGTKSSRTAIVTFDSKDAVEMILIDKLPTFFGSELSIKIAETETQIEAITERGNLTTVESIKIVNFPSNIIETIATRLFSKFNGFISFSIEKEEGVTSRIDLTFIDQKSSAEAKKKLEKLKFGESYLIVI